MFDIAVVGGGIVGLAVARELLERRPGLRLAVVEREAEVGRGQTGANSGVIHAGIYYAPGSLKAQLCVEGARRLYEYCDARGIAHERCGKLVVAVDDAELPRLDELERRGHANGVPGLRRLGAEALREIEPEARGVAALHSPHTGIVDFAAVARALAADVAEHGGEVLLSHDPSQVRANKWVFCAGRDASRLAVAAGLPEDPRIVPFRGAYLQLKPEARRLVRGLIYPVPDPALPFLGVHLTRTIDGRVLLGPTAMLIPSPPTLGWPGTWRVARRFWRTGVTELRLAAGRRAFAEACRRYVPAIDPADVERAFAGTRAQAVARDGTLVDDFVVHEAPGSVHVRNAPSPAATSSLALAGLIADRVERS